MAIVRERMTSRGLAAQIFGALPTEIALDMAFTDHQLASFLAVGRIRDS